MQELYEGIELSLEQTEWICRGLIDLAAVDGLHETEIALIEDFYAAGDDARKIRISEFEQQPFDLPKAVEIVGAGGEQVVEAFLVSCYLLIYADGEHTDAERERIHEYGRAFDVEAGALEELHVKARVYLLNTLAQNIRNKEAVKEIAQAMGLADDQIAGALEG